MNRFCAALMLVFAYEAAALAAELPQRKAGLWEMKTTTTSGRIMSMQQCVDAQTDQAMQAGASGMQRSCSKRDLQRSGNTTTIDSVCTVAGKTTTGHTVITGDFDSGYTLVVTTRAEGMPERSMNIAAKWLGPCAAGQKPGDTIMPNGMKMNLLDMKKGLGQPGPAGTPGAPPSQ